MSGVHVPVTGVELARGSLEALEDRAQPIAASAGLLVAVVALADGFAPAWPLWTVAALLSLGLAAGPLAHRVADWPRRRYALPTVAFAALFVIYLALPDKPRSWPVSPLWPIALMLGLGLSARPLLGLAGGRPVRESAMPIAALSAMLLLLWRLSTAGYWYFTASPDTLHPLDRLPVATLRIVLGLLGFSLVVTTVGGRERRWLSIAAAAGALLVLVLTLASPPIKGIHPIWPFWWATAILVVGLLAEPASRLAELPGARALADRVEELSRTRSGALDVQATELRRIERDLHDGAQVRLVALSLKLGRAEDRYRDDPEAAALLREAREDAAEAIRELRELARGIAPPVLANRGLEAAVRSLAQRSGVGATVRTRLERRPPPAVETAAYFVVAESLTNVAKHAPDARAEIGLDARGGDLFVEITDFGPGGANAGGGGLTGLRQRVEALDGSLRVTSPRGVGTQVEAVIPCGR